MIFRTWGDVLVKSFQDLWVGVINFLPNIVVAVVIFLAGWIVGSILGRVVAHVVNALRVDTALRHAGVETVLHRAGFRLDSGRFLGALVEWFVIIAFLIASFDVLGLYQVNAFLQQVVLLYLPQVIVAVLILLVAGVVSDASEHVVVGAARAAGVRSAAFLGHVTRWAIWVFAILTALYQLGVAAPFVQTLFTGIVIAVSVAVGLAFGLGGQGAATRWIERVNKGISEN